VKTAIIALSAAALIAAAPAVFGQGSKTPSVQHNVSKKRHPGVPATLYGVRCKPRFRRGAIWEFSVTRRANPVVQTQILSFPGNLVVGQCRSAHPAPARCRSRSRLACAPPVGVGLGFFLSNVMLQPGLPCPRRASRSRASHPGQSVATPSFRGELRNVSARDAADVTDREAATYWGGAA
jgi:hypothetical protein